MAISVVLLSWFGALSAEAQVCDGAQPEVVLRQAGPGWNETFQAQVRDELRVALADQGISLCATSASPAAEVVLRTNELPEVALTIEVRDEITQKELRRNVDLATFPADSRAFALAVAADELLRASWIELTMPDVPEPSRPPPPTLLRIADASIGQTSQVAVGGRGHLGIYSGGAVLLGADLLFELRPIPVLRVEFAPGLRRGLPVETIGGDAVPTQLVLGIAVSGVLLRAGALSIAVPVFARSGVLFFDGEPRDGFVETGDPNFTLSVGGGVTIGLEVAGVRFDLRGTVGAIALGVKPQVNGEDVDGATGVEGSVSLGFVYGL
ncbi:MAG: hypothetical protein AAGF12_32355 [Myxococcota bacterium]